MKNDDLMHRDCLMGKLTLWARGPSLYVRIWRLPLYTSESDVCRRQILTYKDPRTEGIKIFIVAVDP